MHRLSLKRLVVLISMIGLVFGFMPTASAHKKTGSEAVVTGIVEWPAGPKSPNFDLQRPPGPGGDDGLSLDIRATGGLPAGQNLLNGCRLKGGNTGNGLPVGDDSTDLCFLFEDLEINAVGLYEGIGHATSFECASSGTNGASGVTPDDPMDKLPQVELPSFGAFYGEFVCDGDEVDPLKKFIPRADGHFHGLSLGGTTIGFLGEVHCTDPTPESPTPCPGPKIDADDPLWDSRIKHTLACKGEVVPTEPGWKDPAQPPDLEAVPPVVGDPPNTVVSGAVTLECVIA